MSCASCCASSCCCCCSYDMSSSYTIDLSDRTRWAIEDDEVRFFIRKRSEGKEWQIRRLKIHDKFSVLDFAVLQGKENVYFYLINNWQDYVKRILHSESSLQRFCSCLVRSANKNIIKHGINLLKENKIDISKMTFGKKKANILHIFSESCEKNFAPIFELLLADESIKQCQNSQDSHGNGLMHYAVNARNPLPILRYLIEERHLSPLFKNNNGETAFDLIKNKHEKKGNYKLKFMSSHGPKLNMDLYRYIQIWEQRYNKLCSLVLYFTQRKERQNKAGKSSKLKKFFSYLHISSENEQNQASSIKPFNQNLPTLPIEIVKHICKFLPSQDDEYQAALQDGNNCYTTTEK